MLPDWRPTAQDRCGQLAGVELAEALKALALQRSSQVAPTLDTGDRPREGSQGSPGSTGQDDLDVATSSFARWVCGWFWMFVVHCCLGWWDWWVVVNVPKSSQSIWQKYFLRPYMACLTSPGPEAWPQEAERTHQGAFQQLHPGIHIFSQVPLATVVSIFSCFSLNFHFYLDFVRWWSLKTMQYHQRKYDFISLLLERFLWCWVIKLTNHLTVLRSTLWHISYGLVASDSTFNASKAQGSWIWTAISLTPRRPASEWADRFLGQSAISL